ncbi:uncharacterized protein LOC134257381 [Saccostrea cucullata]|uniref:uncharacterized protein LOC134257381 n=1 Tax=Saccostrea cuccullata TaxID=36930 RepID=UPI002ED0089D
MDDEERMRILSKILGLAHCLTLYLKTGLNVWDLKEKIIIYSVSINEHFGEKLLKVLESVQDTKDYDNLDIGILFTLLINFCRNIKPPGTGWDYKPKDEDHSVGADIERIRILWNLYCEDQVDVPYLQEMYGRMSDKFGDLSKEGDSASSNKADCNASKQKIQIVSLKTNYNVENGIVVTKNINSAMALLDTSGIVICIGAIGCGKTTSMRYIQDIYKDQGWETVWFDEHIVENERIRYENDKKTSIFVIICLGHLTVKHFLPTMS